MINELVMQRSTKNYYYYYILKQEIFFLVWTVLFVTVPCNEKLQNFFLC